MESRKRAPLAAGEKQKKAGQRGGPQPAKGFLSGSQVMFKLFWEVILFLYGARITQGLVTR